MTSHRSFVRALVGASAIVVGASCKDGSGPATIGPPSKLVLVSAALPEAPANTALTTPIAIAVQDDAGHTVAGTTVTFAVTDGGGHFNVNGTPSTTATVTSDASGNVTLPSWVLGKSDVPQTVQATMGSFILSINAKVFTRYSIIVRFFGPPMTATQQALFSNAAARIRGVVTGDQSDADARNSNFDLDAACGITGQPPLNEIIDDVIVYASIRDIDGPRGVLARAGPCVYRTAPPPRGTVGMPLVGIMEFDSSDLLQLAGTGSLQEVITHEMLHVLGVGVLWDDRGDLQDVGTATVRYTGPQGVQGCRAVGGTVTCASSVPVENTGGAGTADSHWREFTFESELMTGFIDASPNPFSAMTIGSLADLGYVVNMADNDSYTIPGGLLRAARAANVTANAGWEQLIPLSKGFVLEHGGMHRVRLK